MKLFRKFSVVFFLLISSLYVKCSKMDMLHYDYRDGNRYVPFSLPHDKATIFLNILISYYNDTASFSEQIQSLAKDYDGDSSLEFELQYQSWMKTKTARLKSMLIKIVNKKYAFDDDTAYINDFVPSIFKEQLEFDEKRQQLQLQSSTRMLAGRLAELQKQQVDLATHRHCEFYDNIKRFEIIGLDLNSVNAITTNESPPQVHFDLSLFTELITLFEKMEYYAVELVRFMTLRWTSVWAKHRIPYEQEVDEMHQMYHSAGNAITDYVNQYQLELKYFAPTVEIMRANNEKLLNQTTALINETDEKIEKTKEENKKLFIILKGSISTFQSAWNGIKKEF